MNDLQVEIQQRDEEISRLKVELASRLDEEQRSREKYRSQLVQHNEEKAVSARRIQELERELRDYQAEVAQAIDRQARTIPEEALKREQEIQSLKKALRDTTNALQAEKGYHQDYENRCNDLLVEKIALQHQIDAMNEGPAVGPETAKIMRQMLPETERGKDELTISARDNFTITIRRRQSSDTNGLVIGISNERLSAIGDQKILVRNAQSLDSRHNAYREGRFNAYVFAIANPIHACCTGDASWLIRKMNGTPELFVGNDNSHKLLWPDNDKSPLQTWRLALEVQAFTVATPANAPVPLKSVSANLVVVWNPKTNEFFIELADHKLA